MAKKEENVVKIQVERRWTGKEPFDYKEKEDTKDFNKNYIIMS